MTDQEDLKAPEAAAYALGLLSGDRYRQAAGKAHRDPLFADEVRAWEDLVAPLAEGFAPAELPDGLLDRIEARIDAGPVCRVQRASEGDWIDLGPGVRIKVLHRNPDIRRETYVLELAPGAVAEPNEHEQDEECYVVSGDIAFGATMLAAGDYHLAERGAFHGPVSSRLGCVCIIVAAMN